MRRSRPRPRDIISITLKEATLGTSVIPDKADGRKLIDSPTRPFLAFPRVYPHPSCAKALVGAIFFVVSDYGPTLLYLVSPLLQLVCPMERELATGDPRSQDSTTSPSRSIFLSRQAIPASRPGALTWHDGSSCHRHPVFPSIKCLKEDEAVKTLVRILETHCGAAAPARLPSTNDVRRAPGDSRNRKCIRPITPIRASRRGRTNNTRRPITAPVCKGFLYRCLEARFRPNALRIEIGADGTHRSICPFGYRTTPPTYGKSHYLMIMFQHRTRLHHTIDVVVGCLSGIHVFIWKGAVIKHGMSTDGVDCEEFPGFPKSAQVRPRRTRHIQSTDRLFSFALKFPWIKSPIYSCQRLSLRT